MSAYSTSASNDGLRRRLVSGVVVVDRQGASPLGLHISFNEVAVVAAGLVASRHVPYCGGTY